MAIPGAGPLPTSLGDVETLILELYRPGTAPERIATNQETLQRLQRSPGGWQLASSFLNHQNEQIRFFAALTFIIKLNTDAGSLSDEDTQSLLETLVAWLVQCVEKSESALVVRKLCSALVAYFLQFPTSWANCVTHLICCLYSNKYVPYATVEIVPNLPGVVQELTESKAIAVLWFAATLVEEVGKTDSTSMKQHKFHQRVVPNAAAVVSLVSKYIVNNVDPQSAKVRREGMLCFQAWVTYSHRAYIDDEIVLEPLRELIGPAMMCLAEDDLYEITVELFTDVLSNYSKFLRQKDFDSLHDLFNTPWALARYEGLVHGDFEFDSVQFGMFIIAFGEASVQDLTKEITTNPKYDRLLTALVGLTAAEGYAVYEDKIYVPALEFWMTYVETMTDETYSAGDGKTPAWFPYAQRHLMQVIHNCWRKSQFPQATEYNSWDSEDRTGFKAARTDFSDMLQQFYLTTDIPLLQIFVDQIQQYAQTKSWSELEAAMFCMSAFADCVADHPERDDYLVKVFDTSVMILFTDSINTVPTRAMKGFLDLVIPYTDYFTHKPAQLPILLNIVFEATGAHALAKTASRAIVKICSHCREILQPELWRFLQEYSKIASNDSIDTSVKAAVMEGIASIIQTVESNEDKVAALDQLLNYVELDIQKCLTLLAVESNGHQQSNSFNRQYSSGNTISDMNAIDLGVLAMKCLVGMGRGCQVPEEQPVDLEETDVPSSFWTTGKGAGIQNRIYSMICRVYEPLCYQGDIVEEICSLLRLGFREMEPGPFVLPAKIAAQFLMQANLRTPRLVRVISVSCSLISTLRSDNGLVAVLADLLMWLSNLMQAIGEPREEPEIAQACIEFLNRLIAKFPRLLLSHQPASSVEFLLMFTLKALAGNEPLPKTAAAEFWTSFVDLDEDEVEVQEMINMAIGQVGPLLARALVYNIGGMAQRSELDRLCEPVKRLVVRHVDAKKWLEAAMSDASFPSDKVTAKDKAIFLQKIINLRGARGTNQVIREFWLACKGSNFAYAS